jgi:type VII secretion-associated serine protease mycosin
MLAPKAVWPHSTGEGVLVAVVDSGVDADHPQLSRPGKVLPGQDFYLVGDLPGNFDCVSHGTAVASIIAADPIAGVGFAGLAPGARILPVRVTERDVTDNGTAAALDPAVVARGIWYAADQGAKVINLSLSGDIDNQYVRDAVAHAREKDALVVAAVGNGQQDDVSRASFPSAYDGVLGVGAADIDGARLFGSQIGPQVDLVAPGGAVLGAARASGHDYWQGTSFAAPFVSATAALVRAAWPELTAPQVAARILATVSPARGGASSAAYGVGMVDPYRAVTDGLATTGAAPLAAVTVPPVDGEQTRAAAWWDRAAVGTRLAAGGAAVVALLGAVLAFVLTRGRRTHWRPRHAGTLPASRVPDELPDQVFLLPPPAAEQ